MNSCIVCGADISHLRSNARYCSTECKKSKTNYSERTCAMCGDDLSHRPRAKYCGDECAKRAQRQQKRDWRADPVNHERERLSRNDAQNAKYRDNEDFKEDRKNASKKYYRRNRQACLAKDKKDGKRRPKTRNGWRRNGPEDTLPHIIRNATLVPRNVAPRILYFPRKNVNEADLITAFTRSAGPRPGKNTKLGPNSTVHIGRHKGTIIENGSLSWPLANTL